MGSGESKSEDAIHEQTENKLNEPYLVHKKCIHLTYDEYISSDSPLKTQNMYSYNYIENFGTDDSQLGKKLLNSVTKHLKRLNQTTGKEIPLPIYVSCAKKLEVTESILSKVFSSSEECSSDLKTYEELKNIQLPTAEEIQIEKDIENRIKQNWYICDDLKEYEERYNWQFSKSQIDYNNDAAHFNYWKGEEYYYLPIIDLNKIPITSHNIMRSGMPDMSKIRELAKYNPDKYKTNAFEKHTDGKYYDKRYLEVKTPCYIRSENIKKRERFNRKVDELKSFKVDKLTLENQTFTPNPEYDLFITFCNPRKIDELSKKYENTLNKFEWRGKLDIYIYIPNLTKDAKYIPNIDSTRNTNTTMDKMTNIKSNNFQIMKVSDINENAIKFILKISNISQTPENIEKKGIELRKNANAKNYPFLNDMTNICHNWGCVSDEREALTSLFGQRTVNENTDDANNTHRSPYYPTKCLRPINYEKNSIKIDDDLKKDIINKLSKECLPKEGGLNELQIINRLDTCFRDILNEKKGDKENYTKWNHQILSELSVRKDLQSVGVQEITFPIFEFKNYNDNNRYVELPWGNQLIIENFANKKTSVGILEGSYYNLPLISSNGAYKIDFIYNKLSIIKVSNNYVKRKINEQSINNIHKINDLKIGINQGLLIIKGKDPVNVSTILTTKIHEANYEDNMLLILNNNGDIELLNENYGKLKVNKYSQNFLWGMFSYIYSSEENERNNKNAQRLYYQNQNQKKCK